MVWIKSRGDWTAIELFGAGVAAWPDAVRGLLSFMRRLAPVALIDGIEQPGQCPHAPRKSVFLFQFDCYLLECMGGS
jgi:hypothetical protein